VEGKKTTIRQQRERAQLLLNIADGGNTTTRHVQESNSRDTAGLVADVSASETDFGDDAGASGSYQSFHDSHSSNTSSPHPLELTQMSPNDVDGDRPFTPQASGPETPRRLAASLSGRQLLNQRLQKYKLPAVFHADVVGPGQNQRWKGSFWIKGTFIGSSKLERTKGAAKEGAAMAALKWLNTNHYY
jgi:hypothetical protein